MAIGALAFTACFGGVKSIDDTGGGDAGNADATCVPTAEVDTCNLRDDDCDGDLDEDFVPNPPDFARDPGEFESNWYIGNLLIDWRQTPPAVSCPAPIIASEGSSTWSDPQTGDLLFYTNGLQVLNAANVIVPNGDALAGSSTATETSLFAPIPGTNLTELFVFVNNTNAVFASRLLANGEIDPGTLNTPVATGTGEAIGAVEDGAGGMWLAVFAGADLATYHIVDTDIPAAPTQTSALPITVAATSRGTIRFSRQGDRIAIATETPPGHWWADFDPSTGTVVGDWNEIDLFMGFSIDFSPDGKQIYFAADPTTFGFQATELRQHDTVNNTTTVISPSGLIFSGVALAPDGNIYSAANASAVLHRVTDPDVGLAANFEANALDLAGCQVRFNMSKQMTLPSLAGCTDDPSCDDGDDCTADSCNVATGECSYSCTACEQ